MYDTAASNFSALPEGPFEASAVDCQATAQVRKGRICAGLQAGCWACNTVTDYRTLTFSIVIVLMYMSLSQQSITCKRSQHGPVAHAVLTHTCLRVFRMSNPHTCLRVCMRRSRQRHFKATREIKLKDRHGLVLPNSTYRSVRVLTGWRTTAQAVCHPSWCHGASANPHTLLLKYTTGCAI